MFRSKRAAIAAASLLALGAGAASVPAVQAQAQQRAAATLAGSLVPGYEDVVGEYIQIKGYQMPGTPAALNTATFLRLRAAADGENPQPANAVIVSLPGFSSTPAHWLYLGAQLVHKANARTCPDGKPCRVEVWVLQRRGANLADTAKINEARAKRDPSIATRYLFGDVVGSDPARPGKFPIAAPSSMVGKGGQWRPFTPADVGFMADWGFEAYSGDVEAMINLVKEQSGSKTVFLAGHSQGGGFVANYAGRLGADGKRGKDKLAGLIFLDGGPSAGQPAAITDKELADYMARVNDWRAGKANVYTDESGRLGAMAGPAAGAVAALVNTYSFVNGPDAESLFGPRGAASMGAGPAAEPFLKAIRVTNVARAGMSFDTDPLPGAQIQAPILVGLGEGLGRLDFAPRPGTDGQCAPKPAQAPAAPPAPGRVGAAPITCIPTAAQVDPNKVYGWLDGGGNGPVKDEVGKASLWLRSQVFSPTRTNIKPVTVVTKDGRKVSIDASNMVATNWYASERWDFDAGFVGRYRVFKINQNGVRIDVDKSGIDNPVFVARQSVTPSAGNPFDHVADFTEINKTGTYQTPAAKALTPLEPQINVKAYHHTDFVSADDSLAGKVRPGEPGASAPADTLVDWVLKRAKGRSIVPTPKQLGVTAR